MALQKPSIWSLIPVLAKYSEKKTKFQVIQLLHYNLLTMHFWHVSANSGKQFFLYIFIILLSTDVKNEIN